MEIPTNMHLKPKRLMKLLYFTLLFACFTVFGQKNYTIRLDTLESKKDTCFLNLLLFKNDTLISQEKRFALIGTNRLILNGKSMYWFETGQKQKEAFYLNGENTKIESWRCWEPNGNEIECSQENMVRERHHYFYLEGIKYLIP